MQTLSAVLVTLTMLMAATVDAKLYERCELAVKMEEASLNGFMGYGVGDCETLAISSPTHTPSCPTYSGPRLPCHLSPP